MRILVKKRTRYQDSSQNSRLNSKLDQKLSQSDQERQFTSLDTHPRYIESKLEGSENAADCVSFLSHRFSRDNEVRKPKPFTDKKQQSLSPKKSIASKTRPGVKTKLRSTANVLLESKNQKMPS